MKIVITGGAGYLGSVLTPELLKLGSHVTVIDNFMFGQSSLLDCCGFDNFSVIRGDCRDRRLMQKVLDNADLVIPLAALVGAPLCDRDAIGTRSTNLDAVAMICELLSADQKIIFPTTNSGYGIGDTGQYCTEETELRPISLYGKAKVQAEKIILERGNCICFRLATVFGMSMRMRIDLLVNDFVYRAMHDRAVVIFEGHFKRNYIHIKDVARVFTHAIHHFESMKNRSYNVGLDDANLSKIELCQKIQAHLPNFVYIEAPIGEDPDKRDYIVSNRRILDAGFKTEWSLDRGIKELIKGYTIIRNTKYSNV